MRNAVMVIAVSAGLLALGACGAEGDDDDGAAGSGGMIAFNPVGMGGLGGGGGGMGPMDAPAGVGGGPVMAGVGGMAGSTAGSGGTGGMGGDAGTDAGSGASDAGPGGPVTGAIAELSGVSGKTLSGTAMFTLSGMDVALVITLTDCDNGVYPVHIHDAASCDDVASLGEHWGGTRGEGIPAIVCDGDAGMQTHTRKGATAETKWTIGSSAADDVIGHVMVLHGASGPVACGVIVGQ